MTRTRSLQLNSKLTTAVCRWHTHYRWVIMVIVLVIGFGLVAAIGVWLRRRHDLKRGRLLGPGQIYGNPIVAPPPKGIPSAAQSQSGVLAPVSVSSQAARSVPVSTASSSRTNIPASRTPPPRQVLSKPRTVASVEFRSQETRQVAPSESGSAR